MKEKHAADSKMIRDLPDRMQPKVGFLNLEPVRWEYQSVLAPRLTDISDFGARGWELVAVIPQAGDQAVFYFRRTK